MTFLTKHYTLPAFQEGQAISASLDQRRMRIIDQELGFLANLVGDGRISGWQIVDQSTTSEYSFRLKPGIGIIDKFSIETIGPMDFTLPESSSKFYVYLQRKKGVVGGISGFSNMVNIETPYDNTPPSNVSYFTIDGVTESNISLSWNKNLENDISSYILERSLDGSNWSIIEKLDHPTNSYVDESLSENTDYYYRIKAVDINNNESFYTISSPPSITTDKDLSKPALPSSFLSFPQDGQIQLTWTVPEFGNIDYYSIEYFEVDSEYNMIGSPSTSTTIDTKIIIDSLNNSSIYKFILTSVSVNGVSSEEVSLFETPVELNGPSEVVNLSVIDQSDSNNVNQIALSISWDEATGEYAIPADKYEIIIIENGSITSSPIEVSSSNNVSINVLVNNLDSTTEIKPRTDYIILVKSIDSNGNKSNGVIENITTRNFKSPNSPTSLVSIEDNDGNIIFSWNNSSSIFDHNEVIVEQEVDNVTSTIFSSNDFKKSTSYTIDIQDVTLDAEYTLKVKAVDEYGNSSNYSQISISSPESSEITQRPHVPHIVDKFSNDGFVILKIQPDINQDKFASSYEIWRSDFKFAVSVSDWEKIATISSDSNEFIDYTVNNAQGYYYFITTIDRFGNRSLNPEDDGFIAYPYATLYPHENISFTSPSGLQIELSDNDIDLTWEEESDQFDGYEVLRSIGDPFNFEVIRTLDKNTTTFTDVGSAILENTNYYYMIRKYREESKLIVKNSQEDPANSLLLAEINISDSFSVEYKYKTLNINTLSSLDLIDDLIDNHKHKRYSNNPTPPEREPFTPPIRSFLPPRNIRTEEIISSRDRRIDLSENVIIDDFVTIDNLNFTTDQDISSAIKYIVKVDGSLPNVFYSVDPDNKKITFSQSVTGSVTLEAIGLSETQGTLDSEKINEIFSEQINSGTVLKSQISNLSHFGRKEEELIPLRFKCESENGFFYSISQNKHETSQEEINNTISFYDFLDIDSLSTFSGGLSYTTLSIIDYFTLALASYFVLPLEPALSEMKYSIIAAGSNGILGTTNASSWDVIVDTKYPVHKLILTEFTERLFALAGPDVYTSIDGISWIKTNGIDNINIARDLVEDVTGRFYLSTDLGIFSINNNNINNTLLWEHKSYVNNQSSDCYAMVYDGFEDRLLVSNEFGLFESYDLGITWSLTSLINEHGPIFNFIKNQNFEYSQYVFALKNDSVWRYTLGNLSFDKIAFTDSDRARSIHIYNNERLIIGTEDGFKMSNSDDNIFVDQDITLNLIEDFNVNNNLVDALSVSTIEGTLWLGSDKRIIYTVDFDSYLPVYETDTGTSPTVYRDGDIIKLGQYQNSDFIVFDQKNTFDQNISVANQYSLYYPKYGYWIDQNYHPIINIYKNGNSIANFDSTSFPYPSSAFANISFGTLDESNSNSTKAQEYITQYNSEVSRGANIVGGQDILLVQNETIEMVVASIIKSFNLVNSQRIGKVRYRHPATLDNVNYYNIGGELIRTTSANDVYSDFVLVDFFDSNTVLFSDILQLDSTNGIIGFISENGKYDDIRIDIRGSYILNSGEKSHTELEDSFELVNSGLQSSLSQIYQTNLLKSGIYINKRYNELYSNPIDECNTILPIQAKYIIPKNSDFYDNLNSTIDYKKEISFDEDISITLSYVNDSVYVENNNEIWVAGLEGLLKVNINTLDIDEIDVNGKKLREEVKDIFIKNSDIFIITEKNVYKTSDYGSTWNSENTSGTLGRFLEYSSIQGNDILITSYGAYYKNDAFSEWQLSKTINKFNLLNNNDLLYLFDNNTLYISNSGITWQELKTFSDYSINDISFYRGIFIIPTSKGLREDGSTFYGNSPTLSVMNIANDLSISKNLHINSVDTDGDNQIIYAGQSNGNYWEFLSGSWTEKTDSNLNTIHKVLIIDQKPWLIGNDLIKSPENEFPIKLTTGNIL